MGTAQDTLPLTGRNRNRHSTAYAQHYNLCSELKPEGFLRWRLQVTNPPIDPLREGLVMSLEMRLGKRGNLLTPGPGSYAQVCTPPLAVERIRTS